MGAIEEPDKNSKPNKHTSPTSWEGPIIDFSFG